MNNPEPPIASIATTPNGIRLSTANQQPLTEGEVINSLRVALRKANQKIDAQEHTIEALRNALELKAERPLNTTAQALVNAEAALKRACIDRDAFQRDLIEARAEIGRLRNGVGGGR